MAECPPRRGSEITGRLLQGGVHARRAGPDDDRHERDAEGDVCDRQLGERPPGIERLEEEQQQRQPHDDLGGHHRQEQQRLGRGSGAESVPGEPQPQERAQDGRDHDGDTRHLERDDDGVDQVVVLEKAPVPVGREAVPAQGSPRVVEAEQDQDRDGREQQDVDDHRVRGQEWVALAPHPMRLTSTRRLRGAGSAARRVSRPG